MQRRSGERQLGPVIRKASLGYRPQALPEVEVVYFAASESGTEFTVDPWTELQGDIAGFEVVPLEGTHFLPEEQCIIGPTRAPELVAELERRLD